ncbi:MAG: hypothetical protein DRI32_07895, partial [Chloroflexi bacterium]
NILGAISQLILNSQGEYIGDFKLVRSGGEIIFEESSAPLENRVPNVVSEKLRSGDNQPFVFDDSEKKWLIGISEIGITSGMDGFDFGGTFESVDHKKGNTGESWYIINYRERANILKSLHDLMGSLLSIGGILTIFLAFAASFIGNQAAKPLVELIEESKKIAKGDLSSRIITSRKDEIGYLGDAFNNMAKGLEKTTTSIVNLELEIAERRRVEETLRVERDNLKNIFEAMTDGIYIVDQEYNIEYVNPILVDDFGTYEGRKCYAYFHDRDDVCPWCKNPDVFAGKIVRREWRSPKNQKIYDLIEAPLKNPDGGILKLEIFHDITERVEAEQELRESEEKFRIVYENMAVGMARISLDFHILNANQAYCQMLGYEEEELIGKHLKDITQPEMIKENLHKQTQLASGEIEHYRMDKGFLYKSGGTVHGVLDANLIRNSAGEPSYFLGSVLDISERVEAEAQLKLQSLALESAANAIVITDAEGDIQWVNPAFTALTGYSFDDVSMQNPRVLKSGKQDDDFYKVMWDTISKGEIWHDTLVNKRKDGALYTEEMTIAPLIDDEGRICNFVAIKQNVSERIRAKQALQKYANQLETLNTVTAALSTSLELDEVLELILQQIGRVIPLDSGAIFLHEEEGVRVVVDRGIVPSAQGLVFPAGSPLFREIEQTRVPLVLSGVKDDDRFRNWGQSENVESWMGIPLIVRDTLIGFCTLDSFQLDAYSSEQADLALLFASQAAQVIENARQYSAAKRRAARLNALRKIDQAITDGFDIEIMMRVLLENLLEQLQVDAAVVLQYEESLQLLSFCQGVGFHTNAFTHTKLRLGSGQAGKVALERRPIFIPNLNQTENKFFESPEFKKEGFHAYQSVPLITKGVLVGVLEIFHRSPLNLDSERMDFLNVLAGQAAIAIDNVALFNDLQYSNTRLTRAYDATIEGWAGALELKDMETEGHSRRVVEMTTDLAQIFNIREDELLNIRRGALLHDIGKMGVPDRILQK